MKYPPLYYKYREFLSGNEDIDIDKLQEEAWNSSRMPVNLTLSIPVVALIDDFRENIIYEYKNGKEVSYPRSYLIEDLILFVFGDEKRYEEFVNEILEEDEEDEEGQDSEKE